MFNHGFEKVAYLVPAAAGVGLGTLAGGERDKNGKIINRDIGLTRGLVTGLGVSLGAKAGATAGALGALAALGLGNSRALKNVGNGRLAKLVSKSAVLAPAGAPIGGALGGYVGYKAIKGLGHKYNHELKEEK